MSREHKFVAVPAAAASVPMVDACIETSMSTLRMSINEVPPDGYQYVLKYFGTQPSILDGYAEMTYVQALALMDTDDWKGSI
jgi:hypothetical protein